VRPLQRISKLGLQIGNKSWPKALTATFLLPRTLTNGQFDDFLNAVISVKPSWVEAYYRLTKAAEVEHSTLSYRTLANDFRKAVKLPGPNARSSRIAKGPFGPTFAGQLEAEEMADVPDASTQGKPEISAGETGRSRVFLHVGCRRFASGPLPSMGHSRSDVYISLVCTDPPVLK
jgi:hypothetical protein